MRSERMLNPNRPETLLEALRLSLQKSSRYGPGEVPPAVVLWTDADGQWKSVLPKLRCLMPEILVFGEYQPQELQGPAIWLRCVIEGALSEVRLPPQSVPIIYLPDISRQTLRTVEECPDSLKPLVELQYRGTVWCQRNGRDWTVEAFLVSEEAGLELDLAKDNQTRRAMLGALVQLAVTPLSRLRGKRLEAEDFDKLMVEDTPRDILEWINDPPGMHGKWDDARWSAFCSRCRAEYGFDPQSDGELVAGERLGLRNGAWSGVWKRFTEAPALYHRLPELLHRAKPAHLIFEKETWPDENDKAEKELQKELNQLAAINSGEARERLTKLENGHSERRDWVWAKLGYSPLAKALEHLASLASYTSVGLGGDSPKAMADLYVQNGYLADDTVLRALAEVKSAEELEAVSDAVRTIYLPWLQDAAEHFQKLVTASPVFIRESCAQTPIFAEAGTCLLFVDGLRFDLGQRLVKLAQDRNFSLTQNWRWAAVPTVTGTAKPAVSPVAAQIVGDQPGDDYLPDMVDTGQALTSDRLKKLIVAAGYQWLSASEVGQPQDTNARAWTELGEFDKLGHNLQIKLAARIDDLLELLVDRIETLIWAGWRKVRVVTDHGWLLVPGGLPSMTLPKYLTESRWPRCASIKAEVQVSAPIAEWYWNPTEFFAFGTGVRCFVNGFSFVHGGISLQECVIPDLLFSQKVTMPEVVANIVNIQWLGLRCRVSVEPTGTQVMADIRTKVSDPASKITESKPVDADGKVGLLVENDSLEGTSVNVVLLDVSGNVVAKKATTVGGEDENGT
jgi:hypothetical protein